jgi:hypothetical protein
MRQHLTPKQPRGTFNELAYIKLERLARVLAGDIDLMVVAHPEVWDRAHKRFEEALDEWLPLNPQHDKRIGGRK